MVTARARQGWLRVVASLEHFQLHFSQKQTSYAVPACCLIRQTV